MYVCMYVCMYACMYVCITTYIAKVPGIPKFPTSSLSLRRHLATGRAQRGPFLTALEFAADVSTEQAVFHIFDPSRKGELLIYFAYIYMYVSILYIYVCMNIHKNVWYCNKQVVQGKYRCC